MNNVNGETKIIGIILQKGGCGKSTSSVCLSMSLAKKGKKVLIVDMDPQGNIALSFGLRPDTIEKTIYDVFIDKYFIKDVIIKTDYKNVSIVPSNLSLANFDMLVEHNREEYNPALWLKNVISDILGNYDFMIIDCPPSLGWLTVNCLSCASGVIIPTPPEQFSLSGLNDLCKTIYMVKENYNSELQIYGVLMTLFTARTNLSTNVSQEIQKFCVQRDIYVFHTAIRKSVRIGEAQFVGQPPLIYCPTNDAVKDYDLFTNEVLGL